MPQPPPLQVTVYTPGSALRQPSRLLADLFGDVWRGRGLAWRLAVRDISAQYRQTALGLLWALILPLANTAAKAMLAKINFPREALVMSGILRTLFNGGIKIATVLLVLPLFGILPGWTLLLFPLAIISLILASTAFGLLLTPSACSTPTSAKACRSCCNFSCTSPRSFSPCPPTAGRRTC